MTVYINGRPYHNVKALDKHENGRVSVVMPRLVDWDREPNHSLNALGRAVQENTVVITFGKVEKLWAEDGKVSQHE